jgi:ribosomal RNA-processing protein 1
MSDKFPVQHALAIDISNLIENVPAGSVWTWIDEFWELIMREWIGIDRLRYLVFFLLHCVVNHSHIVIRMDKYYMLLRIMTGRIFQLLRERQWDATDVTEFVRSMCAGPLSSSARIPSGIRTHISDLFIDELEKCVSAEQHKKKV